jgi:hypothetical protein
MKAPAFEKLVELGLSGRLQDDAELYDSLMRMRPEDFRNAASLWTIEIKGKLGYKDVQTAAILDRWFELDPNSARKFALESIQSALDNELSVVTSFNRIVAACAARNDPGWALENLLRVYKEDYAGSPNSTLMAEVARRDPSLAKGWLARLEESDLHRDMLAGYVKGMAESDPVAAIDAALSCKNGEQLHPCAKRGSGRSQARRGKRQSGTRTSRCAGSATFRGGHGTADSRV